MSLERISELALIRFWSQSKPVPEGHSSLGNDAFQVIVELCEVLHESFHHLLE